MQAKQQFLTQERASQDKIKHKEAREITGPKKRPGKNRGRQRISVQLKSLINMEKKYDYKSLQFTNFQKGLYHKTNLLSL